ncbi:hypothetical protein ACH5AL_15170 [Actinacidiphila glaucinigra]|uniref:hypothetical protein n=1 Tax=Actinacidiphila glaucinigra TaxID=235986 RepID=UPI0037A59F69
MSTDERLAELEQACVRLRLPQPIPIRMRVAIRRRGHLRRWLIFTTIGTLLYVAAVAFTAYNNGLLKLQRPEPVVVRDNVSGADRVLAEGIAAVFNSPAFDVTLGVLITVGGLYVLVQFSARWPARLHGVPMRHRVSWQMGWLRIAHRYALVMEIAQAIAACAEAHRAGGERLAPALRKVSRRLGAVARGLGTAHRQRSSVPLLSHRRKALKAHERQVIAALRACEARLDSDPRLALEELCGLLVTIADRYCQARVGALLDEAHLQEAVAGPDREWIRTVIWAVITIGGVIGVSLLGLSDGAEPIVMACTAITVAAVVWNRSVRRAIDIVGLALGP